ncbi:hypothetical protein C2W64_04714 [Brevibacillus laterosporus]|nr:hypothetical protein C2W64_04714 [Brevibacillus laterosporus]
MEYELDVRDNFEVYGPEFSKIVDENAIILLYIPVRKK